MRKFSIFSLLIVLVFGLVACFPKEKFNVTFVDHDDSVLKTEEVEKGKSATPPKDPTRTGYTFKGWSVEFENITGDLKIVAQYDINKYEIIFYDDDGTTKLETLQVEYNNVPTPTVVPTKLADDEYTYVFSGWNKELVPATENTSYKAVYTKTSKGYEVVFEDFDGTELKKETVEHGKAATAPANPTREGYTFTGWSVEFTNVKSDLTVVAKYTINTYKVVFEDFDGKELKKETVEHGKAATAPANPTREGYTFTGWSVEFTNVMGNLTVVAKYTINTYEVVFEDFDGTELKKETVEHGKAATAPANPTREGYTFTGWSVEFTNVKSNLTVVAKYIINTYTLEVHYVNEKYVLATAEYNKTFIIDEEIDITKLFKGYIITKLYYDGEVISFEDLQNIIATKNIIITVDVELDESYIHYTVDLDFGGFLPNKSIYVLDGKKVVFDEPTHEDYKFVGWYIDSEFTQAFDFDTTITENITLYAKWEERFRIKIEYEYFEYEKISYTEYKLPFIVDGNTDSLYVITSSMAILFPFKASEVTFVPVSLLSNDLFAIMVEFEGQNTLFYLSPNSEFNAVVLDENITSIDLVNVFAGRVHIYANNYQNVYIGIFDHFSEEHYITFYTTIDQTDVLELSDTNKIIPDRLPSNLIIKTTNGSKYYESYKQTSFTKEVLEDLEPEVEFLGYDQSYYYFIDNTFVYIENYDRIIVSRFEMEELDEDDYIVDYFAQFIKTYKNRYFLFYMDGYIEFIFDEDVEILSIGLYGSFESENLYIKTDKGFYHIDMSDLDIYGIQYVKMNKVDQIIIKDQIVKDFYFSSHLDYSNFYILLENGYIVDIYGISIYNIDIKVEIIEYTEEDFTLLKMNDFDNAIFFGWYDRVSDRLVSKEDLIPSKNTYYLTALFGYKLTLTFEDQEGNIDTYEDYIIYNGFTNPDDLFIYLPDYLDYLGEDYDWYFYADEEHTIELKHYMIITQSLTVYAKAELVKEFKIEFIVDSDGDYVTVKRGETVSEPTNIKHLDGEFLGWYYWDDAGEFILFDFDTPITQNYYLYANYSKTFSLYINGSLEPEELELTFSHKNEYLVRLHMHFVDNYGDDNFVIFYRDTGEYLESKTYLEDLRPYHEFNIIIFDSSKHIKLYIDENLFILDKDDAYISRLPEYHGPFKQFFSGYYDNNSGRFLTPETLLTNEMNINTVFNFQFELNYDGKKEEYNYFINYRNLDRIGDEIRYKVYNILSSEGYLFDWELYLDNMFTETIDNDYFQNNILETYIFYCKAEKEELYVRINIQTWLNYDFERTPYLVKKDEPLNIKFNNYHIGYKDYSGNEYPLNYILTEPIDLIPVFEAPFRIEYSDGFEYTSVLKFTSEDYFSVIRAYYIQQGYYFEGYLTLKFGEFIFEDSKLISLDNYYVVDVLNFEDERLRTIFVSKDDPYLDDWDLSVYDYYQRNNYGDFITFNLRKKVTSDLVIYRTDYSLKNPLQIKVLIDEEEVEYEVYDKYDFSDIYNDVFNKIGYDKKFSITDRNGNHLSHNQFFENIYLVLIVTSGNYEDFNCYEIEGYLYYIKKGEPVNIKLADYHVGYQDDNLNIYDIGDIIDLEFVVLYPLIEQYVVVRNFNDEELVLNLVSSKIRLESEITQYFRNIGYFILYDFDGVIDNYVYITIKEKILIDNYYFVEVYYGDYLDRTFPVNKEEGYLTDFDYELVYEKTVDGDYMLFDSSQKIFHDLVLYHFINIYEVEIKIGDEIVKDYFHYTDLKYYIQNLVAEKFHNEKVIIRYLDRYGNELSNMDLETNIYLFIELILDDESKYYEIRMAYNYDDHFYVLKGESLTELPAYNGMFPHLFSHYTDHNNEEVNIGYVAEQHTTLYSNYSVPVNLILDGKIYSLEIKPNSPHFQYLIEEAVLLLTENEGYYLLGIYCDEDYEKELYWNFTDHFYKQQDVYNIYIKAYDTDLYAMVEILTNSYNSYEYCFVKKNTPLEIKINEFLIGYTDEAGNTLPIDYIITDNIRLIPIFEAQVLVDHFDGVFLTDFLQFTYLNYREVLEEYFFEQGYYLDNGFFEYQYGMFYYLHTNIYPIEDYYLVNILDFQDELVRVEIISKEIPYLNQDYSYLQKNNVGDFIQYDNFTEITENIDLYIRGSYFDSPIIVIYHLNDNNITYEVDYWWQYEETSSWIKFEIGLDKEFLMYDRGGNLVTESDFENNLYLELTVVIIEPEE